MKPGQAKALIQNLINKGHVLKGDTLYTPRQAAKLNIQPDKKQRSKKGESKRFSEKQDSFCHFVKQQTGINLVTEYKFDKSRKWRFDYANEELKLAIECEGGVWSNGRHTRGQGYINDCEKYNAASIQGWTLIRRTPQQLLTQETIDLILSAIKRDSFFCDKKI